jgi:HK97 family phage major capsid protein
MTATPATPENSDEFRELLSDTRRLGEALKAGTFAGLVQDYVDKSLAKNTDMVRQFDEQVQLGVQQAGQAWQARGMTPSAGAAWSEAAIQGLGGRKAAAIQRSRLRNARVAVDEQFLFRRQALGAKLAEEAYAQSWGEFLNVAYKAEQTARERGNGEELERIQSFKRKLVNALSERIPAEGGFLVPENLRSEILMVALESAVVRPRARIIPMDSLRVPLPMIDDVSHSTSVYGGVIGYWTEEGAALTATAPTFGRLVLEAKKLTAYTTIPNELLQDAVTNLETWFNMFFPKAIAWFEDVAFIGSATTGTGVGEPQGFLNAPGGIKYSAHTSNVISFDDIAHAYTRMWPGSLTSAVWICSPDALLQLLELAVTAVSATSSVQPVAPPAFLTAGQAIESPGGGTSDGYHYQLMGRPLIVSEKMPSCSSGNTTTAGALTFVDLDYYLLGDRQTMQVASSEEYLFANDLVAYRVIERVDGRFWLQSAITQENGSANLLSPLILLDTTS